MYTPSLNQRLIRFAIRHGIEPEATADLVQELWLSILEQRSEVKPTSPRRLKLQLFRLLIGHILNHRRFRKRHPSCSASFIDNMPAQQEEETPPGATAIRFKNPEQALFTKEKMDQFSLALSKLTPSQHRVVEQHFIAELTMQEIAKLSGLSLSAVNRLVKSATRRLRQELTELGLHEPCENSSSQSLSAYLDVAGKHHARLLADGWILYVVEDCHHQFKHPTKKGRVTIKHPDKGVHPGAIRSLFRRVGWNQGQQKR